MSKFWKNVDKAFDKWCEQSRLSCVAFWAGTISAGFMVGSALLAAMVVLEWAVLIGGFPFYFLMFLWTWPAIILCGGIIALESIRKRKKRK